jgi:hypothetical protein
MGVQQRVLEKGMYAFNACASEQKPSGGIRISPKGPGRVAKPGEHSNANQASPYQSCFGKQVQD